MDKVEIGRMSEDAAVVYLQKQSYKIRERNFRCSLGEIDIIADDNDVLVFIEVRSKRDTKYGFPQETVNWVKQKKLRRLAAWYIKINNLWHRKCRFDVVGILYSLVSYNEDSSIESIKSKVIKGLKKTQDKEKHEEEKAQDRQKAQTQAQNNKAMKLLVESIELIKDAF